MASRGIKGDLFQTPDAPVVELVEPPRLVERPYRKKRLRALERPVHPRQAKALLDDALALALDDAGSDEPSVEDVLVVPHPVVVVAVVLELPVHLCGVLPAVRHPPGLLDHRPGPPLLELRFHLRKHSVHSSVFSLKPSSCMISLRCPSAW